MILHVTTGRVVAAVVATPLSTYRIVDDAGEEYDVETSRVLFLNDHIAVHATHYGTIVDVRRITAEES